MSLTTTTTTTQVEAAPLGVLERRLQLEAASAPLSLRLRPSAAPAAAPSPKHTSAALTRRFSFVWPFISKDHSAATDPFLSSRCTQLIREFPAFLGGSSDRSDHTAPSSVRDTISRVLLRLKRVWLVLAVYSALVVLVGLSSAVCYAFWCASKPPGLWFLAGCACCTSAILVMCFSSRERPSSSSSIKSSSINSSIS